MTDNTQPEALRLANVCSNLTRHSMDAHLIAGELRRQHARIAELESELEAVGAGGVQALSAAPAVPRMSAAEVNTLPAYVRSYIHQLESLCDPAGLVRENVQLLDTNNALQKMYRRAADACAEVFGCFAAAESEGLKGALSDATDERLKDLVERRLMYAMHAVRDIAASPTAEQQAQPGAVYAELPEPDFGPGRYLGKATGDAYTKEQLRDFADRTHALRMQAAPKAAQVVWLSSKQLRGITALHGQYLPFRQQPEGRFDTPVYFEESAPKAAPRVGNSGFDHKTAADILSGKTVSDEAVRKFVAASRWAHDERAALSATLLAMHGVLTSREAEIALLKKALLEAEAAPQQEAQEPAAIVVECGNLYAKVKLSGQAFGTTKVGDGLYRTPTPPAPLSEMPYEKRKAIQEGEQIGASDAWFKARHEMLDTVDRRNVFRAGFDRGWSAAIAAQGGKDA